ncbi:MFS transporter [Yokenella regensburgei]|uniref:MFS transporter n=1 Tax=Yokenella regensburgei TaxID=158877 RepID=UPI0020774832|nr:MFS transporter [Yokenella regensburgei]
MTYRSKVAVIFLLGFFLDLINMFIASVAWPAMSHSLQATVAGLAWVNNGYIIGLTLAIPLSAWLTRHLGAKRVFLLSLLVFSLGAVASGFAGSLATLVTWRIVQGAGGGLLIPVGQALAWQLYKPHERARLSAAVMLVGLLAPALSPAAGGLLVETLSWRWVFFASVPLSLITLLLAGCWLKPGKNASGPRPLLRLSLLRDPLLRFAMLIYLCVPGIFIGVSVVSMFWLQTIIGLSPAAAGALMLPWSLASFLAITTTGRYFNRLGPRPLIIAGCLLQALGMLALLVSDNHALLVVAFTLMGAGGSLCSSTAQTSAFMYINHHNMTDASALWNLNRQLSFCLGVSLLTLTFDRLAAFLPMAVACTWTFALAATLTLIPLLFCLRLDNRAVIQHITTERERV